jgi:O-antigen/teichoic acid export membrane protein
VTPPTEPEMTPAPTEEVRAGRGLMWKAVQMGGTKGLYLAGTLVLGHLLTPSDFGHVAIAVVVVTSLMTATETGMTPALVQAHTSIAENYDVAWTIGVVRSLFIAAIMFFGASLLSDLFDDPQAVHNLQLMSLWPVFTALASPRQADLMRAFNFAALAAVAIIAVVVELVLSIALAPRLGGAAIVIGKVTGVGAACIASYVVAPYRPRLRFRVGPARQLVSFGRWMFAIGVTAVTGDLCMRVLISRNLGVAALGLFSLADRLAEVPSQVAGEATGSVALALYSRLRFEPPRLAVALQSHLIGVMTFLLPATALLVGLAGPLQEHLLGPSWTGASPLIMILAIGYMLELSFTAVSPLLQAEGAGRKLYIVELGQYIALVSGAGLLTKPIGLMGVGIARILASLVLQLGGARIVSSSLGPRISNVMRAAAALTFFAAVAGGCAWLIATAIGGITGLGAGGVVGLLFFVTVTFLADRRLNVGVRESLGVFFPSLANKLV